MIPGFIIKLAELAPTQVQQFSSAVNSLPADQLSNLAREFAPAPPTANLDAVAERLGPNGVNLAESAAAAEELGRWAAQEQAEKIALAMPSMGAIGGALKSVGQRAMPALQSLGAKAAPALGRVGGAIASNPTLALGAGGAAVGAIGGAAAGGPGHRLSGALGGAATGGALGAGASKLPGVADKVAPMARQVGDAVANTGLRMAGIGKAAFDARGLAELALKHPGKTLGAVGAAGGALHGAMSRDPVTGQRGGLGGAIGGGITGGLVGGAVGGIAGGIAKVPAAHRAGSEALAAGTAKGVVGQELANQAGEAAAKAYKEHPGLAGLIKKNPATAAKSAGPSGPWGMGTPVDLPKDKHNWTLSQLMPVNQEGFTR